jgi:hypothetical protein
MSGSRYPVSCVLQLNVLSHVLKDVDLMADIVRDVTKMIALCSGAYIPYIHTIHTMLAWLSAEA